MSALDDARVDREPGPHRADLCEHWTETVDGSEQLTIAPRDCSGHNVATTWITSELFIQLGEVR